MTTTRYRTLMDLLATLAIIVTCGLLVWANRTRIWPPPPPTIAPPEAPVSLEGAALMGDATAPVALVIYSDYECPYCARFDRDTLPTIERAYVNTGKVRVAMRQHPIEGLHPHALDAAAAAVCAGRQGRFWEMHGALFADQHDLGARRIMAEADRLGLDLAAFASCRADDVIKQRVKAEAAQAEAFGLTGTPAFLVGRLQPDGRVKASAVLSGARPIREFTAAIDDALGERRTAPEWAIWGGLGVAASLVFLIPARKWRRRLSRVVESESA